VSILPFLHAICNNILKSITPNAILTSTIMDEKTNIEIPRSARCIRNPYENRKSPRTCMFSITCRRFRMNFFSSMYLLFSVLSRTLTKTIFKMIGNFDLEIAFSWKIFPPLVGFDASIILTLSVLSLQLSMVSSSC